MPYGWRILRKCITIFYTTTTIIMCVLQPGTDEFKKMVKGMLSQLFVTLYTLTLHPSAHKQLRRHPPKQIPPPLPKNFIYVLL